MADMANEGSKESFVYDRLSFLIYDLHRPRLDTEWLLSTLFDASLLSTSKPPETAALFWRVLLGAFGPITLPAGNHKKSCGWTLVPGRAMICSS
jgi:hypothetical protein